MKIISENRRARYDYQILKTFEAGIVLAGTEVKSLRVNGMQGLSDSYVSIESGQAIITNMYIAPYSQANARFNHTPTHNRVLLLSRKEIDYLRVQREQKGMTIVPTKIYFDKNNRVKIEIALAKGKAEHDKRAAIAERDWERRKAREEF